MFNLDAMIALKITHYYFISSNIIIYSPLVIANTIIQWNRTEYKCSANTLAEQYAFHLQTESQYFDLILPKR